ncbi:hypothetical protein [Caballeronia grimmiae]
MKAMVERDDAAAATRMRDHLLNLQRRIPTRRE